MIKKLGVLVTLVAVSIIAQCIIVNAAFSDVPQGSPGFDAISRISDLKIMGGDDKGSFRPNSYITREQFAKITVKVLGHEKKAMESKKLKIFSDIDIERWSSGYINYAAQNGILSGKSGGTFDPEEEVTFAEVCTIMVRSAGIKNVEGSWPYNFIEQADKLEFTKDMAFAADDKMPRWAGAKMIDRLWMILQAKGEWNGLINVNQLNSDLIVLGDSKTSDEIAENQVLTDRGMYYTVGKAIELLPGGKYKLSIDKDTVVGVNKLVKEPEYLVATGIIGNEVKFIDRKGNKGSFILPDKTIYYYNGVIQGYSKVKELISLNTTFAMAKNDNGSGYEYIVIFDPQYGKPEIVVEELSQPRLGQIKFNKKLTMVRDGKIVTYKDLEAKDVVYKVTDIKNNNPYVLVKNNYFQGKITDIKPNKLSPNILQINGVDYQLNKYFNTARVDGTVGSFEKNSMVSVLLGYDGKIVDLFDDTLNYAFVINSETTIDNLQANERKTKYNAKLLLPDGQTVTYEVDTDSSKLKGYLVKLNLKDDGVVNLKLVSNMRYETLGINKNERKISEFDVTDNIKIYNLIKNPDNSDCVVSLIDWDDMPSGTGATNKFRYINQTGDFGDINLVVVKDILNEDVKVGYIKDSPGFRYFGGNVFYTYSVIIAGTTYSYQTEDNDLKVGDVVFVSTQATQVSALDRIVKDRVEGERVQAISDSRIKLNDKIFKFSPNNLIYIKGKDDSLKIVSSEGVDKNKNWENVTLYFDGSVDSGGRVLLVVLKEK